MKTSLFSTALFLSTSITVLFSSLALVLADQALPPNTNDGDGDIDYFDYELEELLDVEIYPDDTNLYPDENHNVEDPDYNQYEHCDTYCWSETMSSYVCKEPTEECCPGESKCPDYDVDGNFPGECVVDRDIPSQFCGCASHYYCPDDDVCVPYTKECGCPSEQKCPGLGCYPINVECPH